MDSKILESFKIIANTDKSIIFYDTELELMIHYDKKMFEFKIQNPKDATSATLSRVPQDIEDKLFIVLTSLLRAHKTSVNPHMRK